MWTGEREDYFCSELACRCLNEFSYFRKDELDVDFFDELFDFRLNSLWLFNVNSLFTLHILFFEHLHEHMRCDAKNLSSIVKQDVFQGGF